MPSIHRVEILTADSVDRLRVEVSGSRARDIWRGSLVELTTAFDLKFVLSDYEIDASLSLRMADGGSSHREVDAANSSRILRVLPRLTHADATDERLWVTLALGTFKPYVHDRWPAPEANVAAHATNHVFASTARGRERDQAVARLWWTGQYARRFAPDTLIPTLQAIFSNSDLQVQLLGRPNLSTIPPVARGVLALCRTYMVDGGVQYKREPFRAFLEGLDYIAGRRAVGCLSDAEVFKLLEASFCREFSL